MFSKILHGFCRQLQWRTVCALFSETVLAATLVLLAALPLSAGTGDGRHVIRNISDNAALNKIPQISESNVIWRGTVDGNRDIYVAYVPKGDED